MCYNRYRYSIIIFLVVIIVARSRVCVTPRRRSDKTTYLHLLFICIQYIVLYTRAHVKKYIHTYKVVGLQCIILLCIITSFARAQWERRRVKYACNKKLLKRVPRGLEPFYSFFFFHPFLRNAVISYTYLISSPLSN